MKKSVLAALYLAGVIAAPSAMVQSANAQTLEENFNACINGPGQISNEEIVAACTWLIDEAQAENETVGFFYAMRAISNTDTELNCSDGMKARELVTDPKLTGSIDQIIADNC